MLKSISKSIRLISFYLEITCGVTLIIYGLSTYYSESIACKGEPVCSTTLISYLFPLLIITYGLILICMWYIKTWLPYKNKINEAKASLKPEDFVK